MRTTKVGQRWRYSLACIVEISIDELGYYGKVVQKLEVSDFFFVGKRIRDPEEFLESFTYLVGQDKSE